MFDFKFDRPFYRERDFLKIISIPRSTFYSWQSEWIAKGNDPKEMGKITMKESSSVYWNGPIFLKWLAKKLAQFLTSCAYLGSVEILLMANKSDNSVKNRDLFFFI